MTRIAMTLLAVTAASVLLAEAKFNKRDWTILYSSFAGVEKRAVEFLYGELGDKILRDPGVYAFHTLQCEKVSDQLPTSNAFIVGVWNENAALQQFITKEEVPANGFRIRVVNHPEIKDKKLVLIAGDTPSAVLYGVITFFDDLLPAIVPDSGDRIRYLDKIFEAPLAAYDHPQPERAFPDYADAPETLVRSIFTWAHPIGNYQEYFRNMARLKINRVYLWNEFPPLNAAEIVDYAHSWGIEIFWGYAWGWSTNCAKADLENLEKLSDAVYTEWRDIWSKLPGDGIYFQSFTEMSDDKINGKSVAEAVVELVNMTADRILQEQPQLKLVFGLHAMSVKQRLATIDQTDKRLEILWEDCGGFPYRHHPGNSIAEDDAFTRELIAMKRPIGLVFKAQLMQQWGPTFAHQSGPYIMGNNGEQMRRHDLEITIPLWREYCALWTQQGSRAYELTREIHAAGNEVELNLAAQLNGPINFPTALVAELFWSTRKPYTDILDIVLRRPYVRR